VFALTLSHEAYVPAKLAHLCAAGTAAAHLGNFAFSVLVHLTRITAHSFLFDFDVFIGDALYLQGRGLEMRSLGLPSSALPPVHAQVWQPAAASGASDAASVSAELPSAPAGLLRVDVPAAQSLHDTIVAVGAALAAAPQNAKAPLLLVWPRAHAESGQLRGWSRSLRTERWAEGATTYAVATVGAEAGSFPAGRVPAEFEIEWNAAAATASVPRVLAWTPSANAAASASSAADADTHPIAVHCSGGGFAVQWQKAARTHALESDQLRVKITHTALHFKDVMLALGLLPGFALRLGLEACGEVVACGADAATDGSFRVGQRVLVLDFGTSDVDSRARAKPSLLATEVIVSAAQCFAADDVAGASWGNDGWAGFLGVFVTVWKALEGVQRGDSVLVHSALGGVGQSAIQVARYLGAEIYASAGSPARRQQLSEKLGIPIERILDSHRPDSWAAHRDAQWGGRGVDWVLNSLAGEAVAAGMRLLAPGGTFVEIGKRDIWDGTPLSMQLLRDNITFRSTHLDLLSDTHPARVRRACEEVLALLRTGAFTPVPTEVVPAAELSAALRRMSQGKHQGKVIIDVQTIRGVDAAAAAAAAATASAAAGATTAVAAAAVPKPIAASPHALLRLDGTYLLTGATSGVGLAYAQLLLSQGVRRVVLLSRSPALNARAAMQLARFAGRVTVSTERDWSALLSAHRPAAIVHFAAHYAAGAALDVASAAAQEQWAETLRAKTAAWRALCAAIEAAPAADVAGLDFVATTTSLAGLYGNDMQAAYAAANVACVDTPSPRRGSSAAAASTVPTLCMDLPMVLAAGRLRYAVRRESTSTNNS
jgi:NADPH:quinone reductase-like Zn-dependent oxidoreductase